MDKHFRLSGVYKIQSISHPNRIYIGSGGDILYRWKQHRVDLSKNKHHSPQLQNHYNKYGINDLEFNIISLCDKKELHPIDGIIWIEQCFMWVYKYKTKNKPYFNCSPIAGSPIGIKRSEEFCDKLSKNKKGNTYVKGKHWIMSDEARINISNGLKLYYQTEKGKLNAKNQGLKMRGRKKPEGMGKKLSDAIRGEKHHQFGKPLKPETKKKMSIVRTGKKQTEETKKKRVESLRKTRELKKRQNG